MQTCTVLGVDTCTYLPVERRNAPPPPTTPTTSHGLYHNSDRSVGYADQCSLLNPRFGPAMATRGGVGTTIATRGGVEPAMSRYNHEVEPAMATRGGRRPRFEPSMATRGRRPPQHANSEQVVDRRECGRPPGGLAHQSRRRALGFGKSPRNLMPGSETVCANLGICILSHLLEHSLYTVLHLKHLNFVLYIETPKFTRRSRGREQTARPSGAVLELRHEEGADHNGLGQR